MTAPEVIPPFILELREEMDNNRVARFLTMLEDVGKFTNWDVQRLAREKLQVEINISRITIWRKAYLRTVLVLAPELQKYREQSLTLAPQDLTIRKKFRIHNLVVVGR